MKKTQLEELVSKHTSEVDGVSTIDMDGMAADINTSFNELLEKKMPDMDSAKKEWETEYNTSFLKELGYETKDALKEKLTSFDGIDLEQYVNPNLKKEFESLQNELIIRKSGYVGDDITLIDFAVKDYISKSEDENITYAGGLEKVLEIKPYLFGEKSEFKAPIIKHKKPNPPAETKLNALRKKYNIK